MVPPGPRPVGAPPPLLRTNSGVLSGGSSIPSQAPFSSLVLPRNQFNSSSSSNNNMNLIGNMPNVSSLLNQSFGNGGHGPGFSAPQNLQPRGLGGGRATDMVGAAELDPLSSASSSGAARGQQLRDLRGAAGGAGNLAAVKLEQQQMDTDDQNVQLEQQQMDTGDQNVQLEQLQSMNTSIGAVKMEPQQRLQSLPNNVGPVKMETQQQLQSLYGRFAPVKMEQPPQLQSLPGRAGSVKMETQQLDSLRNLGPVKMEHQHLDPSLVLQQQQQQQQQQQLLQLQNQSTPMKKSHQQLMSQMQQQQFLKSIPQQAQPLAPTTISEKSICTVCSAVEPLYLSPAAEAGGKLLFWSIKLKYELKRNHLLFVVFVVQDNNIGFWRKLRFRVFCPNAKKRWCVSLYGSGRQTTVLSFSECLFTNPQDVWHCELCNCKPGRGFETTVEVLPRLYQIKYASGTLEELLYIDMPRERQTSSGQIVLEYAKAIQESVFDQLRVVRDGQLRIVFNPDLKIASWEFCARRHEELIPRRVIIPQVSQLGTVVQKYQFAAQNASSGLSTQDLQSSCNSFTASACQLAKALDVPLVNDLGYTKRYVRCLQISEVVNCMNDLIEYSTKTGTGPIESLMNFPRRNSGSSTPFTSQAQQPKEQPSLAQNSNPNSQSSLQTSAQFTTASNSVIGLNNNVNIASSATLRQNSMNSRQENPMNSVSNPCAGGSTAQIPSASPSSSVPPSQPNPSLTFTSPTLSTSSNNPAPASNNTVVLRQRSSSQPDDANHDDSQSSVQRILQEMEESQRNGVSFAGNALSQRTTSGGTMRDGTTGNALASNVRTGMNHISQDPLTTMNHHQRHDTSNRLLGGLGSVKNFSNLQYDWKTS
ncbi:hypothetical protein J5N97_021116 [Dioscorea zingiberensis]|uniref:Transcriptional corepressor SEUSS n=1 Tax=Dioscorea zingiberensis TaxID=325984 RepID=A0A9D5HED9_9LILI|nr:hypothetical protein J5N97_021116 [Dioscorea zingiberensis]